MPAISASVGRSGVNKKPDVKVVQELLNDFIKPPMKLLDTDGIVGPKTIAAIEDFQKRIVKMRQPDGRVDKDGPTLKALNGETGSAAPAPQQPGKLPPSFVLHEKAIKQTLEAEDPSLWPDFVTAVKDTTTNWGLLFNVFTTADEVRKVAQLYRFVRHMNLPTSEAAKMVKILNSFAIDDPVYCKEVVEYLSKAKKGTTFGKFFDTLGRAGKAAGFIKFLVEYYEHWKNGDYHMAFVEIYKTYMSDAIPLAGLADAVESFLSSDLPGVSEDANKKRKNSIFYKCIRAVNLIGLGAVAVDTAGVLVHSAVTWELDSARFERLLKRMKESPAQVFVGIGEDLANALAKISDMSDAEFKEMFSLSSLKEMLAYALSDD